MTDIIARFRQCERGVTAIEFAFILLPLILVSVGTIELGRALWIKNDMAQNLDRVERRILILQKANPNDTYPLIKKCGGVATLEAELKGKFSSASIGSPTQVSQTIGSTTVTANYRLLTVTQTLTLIIPGLSMPPITMTNSRLVLEPSGAIETGC